MLGSSLRCPLCHEVLALGPRSAACAQGHNFDRARTGYLNLLPVQRKHSREPGDNTAMVAARTAFLEAGYYAPIRAAVCAALDDLRPDHVLDSGCGEGWYTLALSHCARQTTALDISKLAIRRAAVRAPAINWLVASTAELPLLNASVDAITAIFSPIVAAEAARVLRPDGRLLIVAPAARHLWELRAVLYADVRAHQPDKWLRGLAPYFTLERATRVEFRIELADGNAMQDLLGMTPFVWQAARAKQLELGALAAQSLQADVQLLQFALSDRV